MPRLARFGQRAVGAENIEPSPIKVHIAPPQPVHFDAIASALPRFDPDTDALLRGWVQSVRYNVYGFALWEATAARYQERKAVVGDTALVAPVTIEMAGG